MSFYSRLEERFDWSVNLPGNWRSDWLKWIVQLSTERPATDEQDNLPYISNEDITSWTGELLTDDPQPSESEGRKFEINDVLFNKLRPYLAKVYHARFKGVSSSELLCLRPSAEVLPRFLFYVLVSKCFINTVDAESFGAKMPRADWEIVGHQPFPLPPIKTQRHIADFLDEKTARIDELIEKKQALLDRLAEKRQASITRAVTKGLTEDKLCDVGGIPSGLSWKRLNLQVVSELDGISLDTRYDEQSDGTVYIPENWRNDWLKWSVQLSTERPTIDEQDSLPYISNEDITSWTGKLLTDEPQPSDSEGRKFRVDDVLFNKLRPYLAKVYHACFDGVSSGELLCLRPSEEVIPRFLFYVLTSKCFIDTIDAESFGAKMPRADWKIVGHLPLPLPSIDTQYQIVGFLDEKIAQIEELVEKISLSIELLYEYRSALITAAVTGQTQGLV